MPELPEVETVARLIRPDVVGRTIKGVSVGWERTLGGVSRRAFATSVRGASVAGVSRRAKFILLSLLRGENDAGALVVHLRMTGRLHVEPAGRPPGPYTRVALALDDGRFLDFVDVRKFGRFEFHKDPTSRLAHLGPEPLEPGFDRAWLRRALAAC